MTADAEIADDRGSHIRIGDHLTEPHGPPSVQAPSDSGSSLARIDASGVEATARRVSSPARVDANGVVDATALKTEINLSCSGIYNGLFLTWLHGNRRFSSPPSTLLAHVALCGHSRRALPSRRSSP
jgi:hypothetical protein